MASITFPNGGQPQFPTGPSASIHEMEYFSSFEASADGSFQMNPLSARPPRTSRASVASTSYTYGSDLYASIAETEKQVEIEVEAQSDDEDEQAQEEAASGVRKEVIWQEMLLTANGRDKTFVCSFQSVAWGFSDDVNPNRNSCNTLSECTSCSTQPSRGARFSEARNDRHGKGSCLNVPRLPSLGSHLQGKSLTPLSGYDPDSSLVN